MRAQKSSVRLNKWSHCPGPSESCGRSQRRFPGRQHNTSLQMRMQIVHAAGLMPWSVCHKGVRCLREKVYCTELPSKRMRRQQPHLAAAQGRHYA